ncbi:Hypothetical protein, putative [Bodo saltans]|uniref:3'-5' exonuclease domain-containing protein n=1 Tax=Bodo saltans TaxID=75058 RepID=A0A0S4JEM9_BODSA|nr:Hypothetical protein, putative [Bodo saltans]|eukprot:CUG88578.1 Hypothetical protein, putative [Bodo saltans]
MVAFSKPIISFPPPAAVRTLTRPSHSRHRAFRIPNRKPPSQWISWARQVRKREPAAAAAPADDEVPAADATRIVGLDCEWTLTSPLTVLQIGDADAAFVFQVEVCGGRPSRRRHVHALWLPNEVRSFLESSATVKCGVNVTEDVRLIRFDIDRAAQTDFGMGSQEKYCGLKTLFEVFLGVTLNKEQQTSDFFFAGDSCPHIHKNRIAAQEELYEEWGRMFATRDFSSTCIACGTSLLDSQTNRANSPDAN